MKAADRRSAMVLALADLDQLEAELLYQHGLAKIARDPVAIEDLYVRHAVVWDRIRDIEKDLKR